MVDRSFLNLAPTVQDEKDLGEYIATYRDGSGNYREKDGSYRADPRQIERCIAELLHGTTTENKSYYDFVLEDNANGQVVVSGASVKSKEVPNLDAYYDDKTWKLKKAVRDRFVAANAASNERRSKSKKAQKPVELKLPATDARAYLELSNQAAKNKDSYLNVGLTDAHLAAREHPERFGEMLLKRQVDERKASEASYIASSRLTNAKFAEDACVFISVLYTKPGRDGERKWVVSSFSCDLPAPEVWKYRGGALVGYDADGAMLYEWYHGSGSQFKYYPKLKDRLFGTGLFKLPKPAVESLKAKADRLFRAKNVPQPEVPDAQAPEAVALPTEGPSPSA